MKCKKLIILGIAVLMFVQCIYATKSYAEIKTGTKEDVTWSLDTETGVLTFSGTGVLTVDSLIEDTPINEAKKIVIGKDILFKEGSTEYDWLTWFTSLLEEIEVDENNENYSSIDGVLFDKNKTKILFYPKKKNEDYYVIPSGVTTIGTIAFNNCSFLKEVSIPDTVETIEKFAFSGCDLLTSITIPDSITTIEEGSFYLCDKLAYVEIPDSVTSIGDYAFCPDNNRKAEFKIVIPESVKDFGKNMLERPGGVANFDFVTIYCKSGSAVEQYAIENNVEYVIDDDAPTITNVTQEDSYINIEATDNEGVGLKKKAYSLDGENWVESNKIAVEKSGTYTVYVRDKLYNVSSKEIIVDIKTEDTKTEEKTGDTKTEEKTGENNNPKRTDDTQAKDIIPDTGAKFPFVIVIVAVIAGIVYKKYKKYNFKK